MDRIGVDAADMAEVRGGVEEDRATEAEEETMQKVDDRHHIFPLQGSTTRNQRMADILNLFPQRLIWLLSPTIMAKRRPFRVLKIRPRFHLSNMRNR